MVSRRCGLTPNIRRNQTLSPCIPGLDNISIRPVPAMRLFLRTNRKTALDWKRMEHPSDDRLYWVTPAGRTVSDANALLREPKVQQTLARLAANKHLHSNQRGRGITVVRRIKQDV